MSCNDISQLFQHPGKNPIKLYRLMDTQLEQQIPHMFSLV